MKFALVVAIAVSLLMALFAVQNAQQTQVTFLGKYFDGPLVIVLLLSFAAGAVATFLAMIPGSLRKSIDISKLKSSLAERSAKLELLEKQSANKEALQKKEIEHDNIHQKS